MPAPKGHPRWGNPLKPKKYTPEALWEKALEYFEWCDNSPWHKNEAIKSGDMAGSIIEVPTKRPYTKEGLCVYLNISLQTLLNYESAENYETHFEVTKHINNIIRANQLEGASVGAYNPSIISQLLGLVNKQSVEHSGEITQKNIISFGGKEVEV